MRWLSTLSLCLNLFLAAALWFVLQRLGGIRYAWYKFHNDEAGLYTHRKSLFSLLPVRPGSIIFLGDSQTQEAEWREFFGDSLPILNRGIVGDHVDGVWSRLSEVLRHRPSKIFLCIGENDLLFGKPPGEIEGRYREIVQRIRREMPEGQVIVQSIPPVNNAVKWIGIENETIRGMNGRLAQIAKDYALPYADIHALLADANGNLAAKFTDDGLHLNGAGYMVWRKEVEPFLK